MKADLNNLEQSTNLLEQFNLDYTIEEVKNNNDLTVFNLYDSEGELIGVSTSIITLLEVIEIRENIVLIPDIGYKLGDKIFK